MEGIQRGRLMKATAMSSKSETEETNLKAC